MDARSWLSTTVAFVLVMLLAAGSSPAIAGDAAPLAQDPALEERVTRLGNELRCLVCQNQTIADSHSGLANDLKQQIREQLRAGKTDAQVMAYMVERYGDFVLYRPPMKGTTALLWYGPFVLLAAGFGVVVLILRRRRPRDEGESLPYTDAQRSRAAELLAQEETRP
ncbi:MAG: cytochrome c-type biogenesis protein CcmH [Burkholderiales bacterium]|nr:cytochrome c-type biogenesis protein CcmH [Burkholderiales bacterium]